MINTTIKVISSDGKHSSEEVVIAQSAGDMDMEEDVQAHKNACSAMLSSVEHAVEVTIERIQDQIDAEKPPEADKPTEDVGKTEDKEDDE